VREHQLSVPVVRIGSQNTWPTAMAVVLHLYKQSIPVSVEPDWVFIAGAPLAAGPGTHAELVFGDRTYSERVAADRDLPLIATAGAVYVYCRSCGN